MRYTDSSGIVATAHDEAGTDFLRGFIEISKHHDEQIATLSRHLRSLGIIALHPLDGWVKRIDANTIHFQLVYPRFRSKTIEPGDLVAFDDSDKVHIYTVDSKVKSFFVDDKWQAAWKETLDEPGR